jgi:LysM repeat protein
MTCRSGLFRGALLLLAGGVLCGCLRPVSNQVDEEKESHFLLARSRFSKMDYQGALESYEKALEVNPRSAAAHLELATTIVYLLDSDKVIDQKDVDQAAAIYHFQQYLKLRPKALNAQNIKDRIVVLKRALGSGQELQRLENENRRLREELERGRFAGISSEGPTNSPVQASLPASAVKPSTPNTSSSRKPPPSAVTTSSPPSVLVMTMQRTHTVKPGETAATIASRYSVRLEALNAANPKLTLRHLRPGQTLNIPAPNR